MSDNVYTLTGDARRVDPVFAVSNLSSIFTVCAIALHASENLKDDIRRRAFEEIVNVLHLGATIASDSADLVDEAIVASKKGGAK